MYRLKFLFIIIFVFNCSKDSSEDNRFEGTMEARINGIKVVFDNAYGYGFYNLNLDCYEPFHQIYGSLAYNSPDGHNIVLNFNPSLGLGTYNPNATYITWEGPYNEGINNVNFSQNHFCLEDQTHYNEEGEVSIISTSDNKYKGIFNFKASDPCGNEIINITDGKFEISKEDSDSCN